MNRNTFKCKLLFACIILAFASCGNDKIEPDANELSEDMITLNNSLSRGVIATTSNVESLGVFCYTTPLSFSGDNVSLLDNEKMYNIIYERRESSNVFEPGGVYEDVDDRFFWDNQYHHFFIYSPYETSSTQFDSNLTPVENTTGIALEYIAQYNTPQEFVDLIYASKRNTLQTPFPLATQFYHALSKVSVSAKVVDNVAGQVEFNKDKHIYIRSISLSNIVNKGVISYVEDGASWELSTPTSIGSYLFNTQSPDSPASETKLSFTEKEILSDAAGNSALFLIPQTINPANNKLTVSYYYMLQSDYESTTSRKETFTKIIDLPAISWQMGSAYSYVISFDLSEGTPEVTIEGFEGNDPLFDEEIAGTTDDYDDGELDNDDDISSDDITNEGDLF